MADRGGTSIRVLILMGTNHSVLLAGSSVERHSKLRSRKKKREKHSKCQHSSSSDSDESSSESDISTSSNSSRSRSRSPVSHRKRKGSLEDKYDSKKHSKVSKLLWCELISLVPKSILFLRVATSDHLTSLITYLNPVVR